MEAAKRLALGYADEDDWAGVRVVASRVMEGEGGIEGVAGGSVVNPKGRLAPTNGWAWKALGSTEMVSSSFLQTIVFLNEAGFDADGRRSITTTTPRPLRLIRSPFEQTTKTYRLGPSLERPISGVDDIWPLSKL